MGAPSQPPPRQVVAMHIFIDSPGGIGTALAYLMVTMPEKRPKLSLRAACAVGGKPGPVAVAPDAAKLYVFDLEVPRITVVGTHGMEVLRKLDLGSHRPGARLFLG